MSNQNNKTDSTNRPSHYLYVVEGEGDNEFWTKIGAVWSHKDGKGANMKFSAFPATGGRVVMRDANEAAAKEPKAA